MSTKKILYRDDRVIRNGTTTIVYGISKFKRGTNFETSSVKLYNAIRDVFTGGYETKGVSKLNPEDKYSESIGVAVASNKAELCGNKTLRKDLKELLELVKAYEGVLTEAIDELDERVDKIKSIER